MYIMYTNESTNSSHTHKKNTQFQRAEFTRPICCWAGLTAQTFSRDTPHQHGGPHHHARVRRDPSKCSTSPVWRASAKSCRRLLRERARCCLACIYRYIVHIYVFARQMCLHCKRTRARARVRPRRIGHDDFM